MVQSGTKTQMKSAGVWQSLNVDDGWKPPIAFLLWHLTLSMTLYQVDPSIGQLVNRILRRARQLIVGRS